MKGRSPEQYSSSPAGRTSLDKFGAPSTKEDLSPRQEIEKESEFSYFSPWNPTKTGGLLLAFCREKLHFLIVNRQILLLGILFVRTLCFNSLGATYLVYPLFSILLEYYFRFLCKGIFCAIRILS